MHKRGELLLVPFPFTDLSATKRRPVAALTAPDSYGDFIAFRSLRALKLVTEFRLLPPTCCAAGCLPRAGFGRIASSL